MNIAIIGAGFTGLSSAYYLAKKGHQVTVIEGSKQPGGLASGFIDTAWDWPLENYYHHLFTSDNAIRGLAKEVGHKIIFTRPVTSTYLNGKVLQLDSPVSLLKFSQLSVIDRIRTGVGIAFFRYNPFWQPLQYLTAQSLIKAIMGNNSWKLLWEPLLTGKFGQYSDQISAAWYWARITKRSALLGYPEKGFLSLAKSIQTRTEKLGVKYIYNTIVSQITPTSNKQLKINFVGNDKPSVFDKVISTQSTHQLQQVTSLTYPKLPGLGALNLVLELNQPFLQNGVYWLNINDRTFPFLSVVEHTNFISSSHYANHHLLYIGNYLPANHEYFSYSTEKLLRIFSPYLKLLNPSFSPEQIENMWVFKAAFAQPVVTPGYQDLIPNIKTKIPNLYLANIQQVYPYDRGTNYAVELGYKTANICINS